MRRLLALVLALLASTIALPADAAPPAVRVDECGSALDNGILVTPARAPLSCEGSLGPGDDRDSYFLTLTNGTRVRASIEGPAEADFDLCVVEPGLRTAACSDTPAGTERIDHVTDRDGRWRVEVSRVHGAGDYRLRIETEPDLGDDDCDTGDDASDDWHHGTRIGADADCWGRIASGETVDAYKFLVEGDAPLLVTVTPDQDRFVVCLVGPDGVARVCSSRYYELPAWSHRVAVAEPEQGLWTLYVQHPGDWATYWTTGWPSSYHMRILRHDHADCGSGADAPDWTYRRDPSPLPLAWEGALAKGEADREDVYPFHATRGDVLALTIVPHEPWGRLDVCLRSVGGIRSCQAVAADTPRALIVSVTESGNWSLSIQADHVSRIPRGGGYSLWLDVEPAARQPEPSSQDDCGTGSDAPSWTGGTALETPIACQGLLTQEDWADAYIVSLEAGETLRWGVAHHPLHELHACLRKSNGGLIECAVLDEPTTITAHATDDYTLVVYRWRGSGEYTLFLTRGRDAPTT